MYNQIVDQIVFKIIFKLYHYLLLHNSSYVMSKVLQTIEL